jgi:SAM-dependent methyltransferase
VTPPAFHRQLWSALRGWWWEQSRQKGAAAASTLLVRELWTFLRDSTPERRRRRYGDMEYDWEHRVNTTSGTVGWRERLLGVFHSPYQPTDAALFQEMMASLPIDFSEFTFVDLGSGKGRTLLMASEYPFRRIVGVEILPELHRAAEENIASYRSTTQQCARIESVCAEACEFDLPEGPLLLYLFNPLPEAGLDQILENLEESLRRHPRAVYVLYQNPLLERVLEESPSLKCTGGTHQYSIHTNAD